MLVYVWSREFLNARISIYGLVSLKVPFYQFCFKLSLHYSVLVILAFGFWNNINQQLFFCIWTLKLDHFVCVTFNMSLLCSIKQLDIQIFQYLHHHAIKLHFCIQIINQRRFDTTFVTSFLPFSCTTNWLHKKFSWSFLPYLLLSLVIFFFHYHFCTNAVGV